MQYFNVDEAMKWYSISVPAIKPSNTGLEPVKKPKVVKR